LIEIDSINISTLLVALITKNKSCDHFEF